MKIKPRRGSWILFVLCSFIFFTPSNSKALVENGINVTVYNNNSDGLNRFNSSPSIDEIVNNPIAGTTTFPNVNQNFDQYPPYNLYDDFAVHYEGYITSPISGQITFLPQADDGTKLYINNQLIEDDWYDKGSGGSVSSEVSFEAGVSQKFDMWFYENGGGAWVQLYWNIGNGWEIVPDSAFTLQSNVIAVDTTIPETTTTTVPETTTTTTLPLTGAVNGCGPYRASVVTGATGGTVWGSGPYTDDSNFAAAAVHAGLIKVGETATIEPYAVDNYKNYIGSYANGVYTNDWKSNWCGYKIKILGEPIPTTTTTTTTTTSTTTTSTTTTTIPVETTTTTQPVFVNPFTTTTTVPSPASTTTTTTVPETTTSSTTTTIPVQPEVKTLPSVEDIKNINNKDDLQKLIQSADLNNINADQALAIVSNDSFVELPKEQLAQVFESIPINELTAEQESQLVETLTNAPDEVKNTFENSIDIYSSGLDDYTPVGSNIDVGTRRSLIAATTVLATVAVVPPSNGGPNTPNGSEPNGPKDGPGNGNGPGKKDEDLENQEEDEEDSVEIEGPEDEEEENNYTKNSIFKYQEGTMKRRLNLWGFLKKFSKETAAMAFTISGSVVVFATLSGETRKITLIATGAAFIVHYINVMLKNDE